MEVDEHPGYRMMALEVEDMTESIEYLRAKGVEIHQKPRVREGIWSRAEIKDPNGFRIELRQWFGSRSEKLAEFPVVTVPPRPA